MVGFLTTHALDTSRGTPAANLKIDFFEYHNGRGRRSVFFNHKCGWTNRPACLGEKDFRLGTFELIFHVGDYYRQLKQVYNEPVFLDLVPIRFGMSENKHYTFHSYYLLRVFHIPRKLIVLKLINI